MFYMNTGSSARALTEAPKTLYSLLRTAYQPAEEQSSNIT